MNRAAVLLAFGLVVFAQPEVVARQDDTQTKVEFRVTTAAPGRVVVDRGTADGLKRGDRVTLRPKQGGTYLGSITEPLERIATIELDQRAAMLETGTKGDALVPKDRLKKKKTTSPAKDPAKDPLKDPAKAPAKDASKDPAKAPAKTPAKAGDLAKAAGTTKSGDPAAKGGAKGGDAKAPTDGAVAADAAKVPAKPKAAKPKSTTAPKNPATSADGAATQSTPKGATTTKPKSTAKPGAARAKSEAEAQDPTKPVDWSNKDEGFKPDMSLLSDVGMLKPDERLPSISGSVWAAADYGQSQQAKNSNGYFRAGAELDADNLLHQGGSLHFDAELDYRTKWNGHSGTNLLLRGLSYTFGGNRFTSERVEVGRFLQHDMPEFGFLDGIEWSHRTTGGNRLGASFGYMPTNDDDFNTFEDLQLSAHYDIVADDSERCVLTGAVQQTWHKGDRDRELLIAKALLQSGDGWDFRGTLWVDYYNKDDDAKNTGLEITQAVVSLTKSFEDGDGMALTFDEQRFPELERQGEYIPLSTIDELADNHVESLALSAWTYSDNRTRFHARGGVWDDEDESGSYGEAGIEFPNVVMEDSRCDFTAFMTKGQFESILGGRVNWGLTLPDGRWDLFYEYGGHRSDGFSKSVGDIVQQRAFLSRSFYFPDQWLLTLNAGVVESDTELSWDAGFFVRKSF